MKLFIRNKLMSIKGNSSVVNEQNQDVFKIDGKFFTLRDTKNICNLQDNVLYTVKNRYFNFLSRAAFVYDANGNKIATVRTKPFQWGKYFIEDCKDEILIEGDFLSFESSIKKNGQVIGKISRKFDTVSSFLADAFMLEADDEDMPFLIALVIAIDIIQDKANRDRKR